MNMLGAGRMRVLAVGLLLAASAGIGAVPVSRPTEFDICQGCHGVSAQGNAELGAPRIAGLDAQYIGRQLADFRDGRRGAGDSFGTQMAAIASMLDDTAIGRLSAYVSAMPEVQVTPTRGADLANGKGIYATCAACHGDNGEGGASLGSPRLAGMSDWYLARQFALFASGKRGSTSGDERGSAMRGIAASVTSADALRDVIAYAVSLQLPASLSSKACANDQTESCGSSR